LFIPVKLDEVEVDVDVLMIVVVMKYRKNLAFLLLPATCPS
jgi:hypothetical protein